MGWLDRNKSPRSFKHGKVLSLSHTHTPARNGKHSFITNPCHKRTQIQSRRITREERLVKTRTIVARSILRGLLTSLDVLRRLRMIAATHPNPFGNETTMRFAIAFSAFFRRRGWNARGGGSNGSDSNIALAVAETFLSWCEATGIYRNRATWLFRAVKALALSVRWERAWPRGSV